MITRAEAAQRDAGLIIRAEVARFTIAWVAEQKHAGRRIKDVHAEITRSQQAVEVLIARAVMALLPPLRRIADAGGRGVRARGVPEAEDGIDFDNLDSALLDAERSTGRAALHPRWDWWPC